MIKAIIRLNSDVTAVAGQLLVLDEHGNLEVASPESLGTLLSEAPNALVGMSVMGTLDIAEGATVIHTASNDDGSGEARKPSRKEMAALVQKALLAGHKPAQVMKASGASLSTVLNHRKKLIADGLMSGDDVRAYYKTPEALERAKERGRRLGEMRAALRVKKAEAA